MTTTPAGAPLAYRLAFWTIYVLVRIILLVGVALLALLLAGLAFVYLAGPAGATPPPSRGHDPVTICHNGHTITVDDDAVPAHLAHGDTVGECTPAPTEEPTPWPTTTNTATPSPEHSATPTTPTPEPSTSPTSTPTAPVETPATAAPPVDAPSAPGTVSSGSTSPAPSTVTGSEVGTVATLAETGTTVRDVVVAAVLICAAGLTLLWLANRRRPR